MSHRDSFRPLVDITYTTCLYLCKPRGESATRVALLESAARHLSRYGYGNLKLEEVARDAGYTRGALYHQFADKDDLVLAVLAWVDETWREEAARADRAGAEPGR